MCGGILKTVSKPTSKLITISMKADILVFPSNERRPNIKEIIAPIIPNNSSPIAISLNTSEEPRTLNNTNVSLRVAQINRI